MQCPQCDKEYANAEGVTRHRQVVHHNLKKPSKGGRLDIRTQKPVSLQVRTLPQSLPQ